MSVLTTFCLARKVLCEAALLQYGRPNAPSTIGVLLLDVQTDTLLFQITDDWSGYTEEEVLILQDLHDELAQQAVALGGGAAVLSYWLRTLSNAIQVSAPSLVYVADPHAELIRRYQEYVVGVEPATYARKEPPDLLHATLMRAGAALVAITVAVFVSFKLWMPHPSAEVTKVRRDDTRATVKILDVPESPVADATGRAASRAAIRRRPFSPPQPGRQTSASFVPVPHLPNPIREVVLLEPDIAIDVPMDVSSPVVSEKSYTVSVQAPRKRVLQALTYPFRKVVRIIVAP